jgi:hypothetical protein
MNQDEEKARKELEEEFAQVRESLGDVHVAFDAVLDAGPEDDLHDLLEKLEDAAREARTGGLIGSGAKGHRRARKKYLEVKNP